MSEFLSAGVYIEEVSNAPQTVQAISTSTMAIVGFTLQGPINEATLITSPSGYTQTFGAYTNESLMAIEVSAFFNNGGTRCYVIRVVPSDAVIATGSIGSAVVGEVLAVGTGATPQTVAATLLHPPATAGTVVVGWTPAIAVTSETPTLSPPADGTALDFTTTLAHHPMTNDVVTIVWTESSVSKTATITGASTIGGANAANVGSASIIRTTGGLTIAFAAGHAPDASSVRASYSYIGTPVTVTDNGSGAFSTTGVSGTINYATGVVSITFTGSTVVPYNGGNVTAGYTGVIWGLAAANPGAWGDDLQFILSGSPNFLTYGPATVSGAGTYSRFDITITQENSSGVFEVKETYSEVSFSDPTDAMYVTDVINQGSELVVLSDFGYDNVPGVFDGVQHSAESIGTGDASTKTFTHTIVDGNLPVLKTSAVFSYTISSTVHTATSSSAGVLAGVGLDATKTNTINYASGVITLNFSTAPDAASAITVNYITAPSSSVTYTFSGGSDGTIADITNLTVSNAVDLQADKLGMYALDRIDEMMILIIPDFAGDTTVQNDMIAYAEDRRDLFCILTTPVGTSTQAAVDYAQIDFPIKSKYAAIYWPWVNVADPTSSGRTLTVPVVGHVAGIYARTDNNKNVSKAPAGTVDGALAGVLSLETNPGQADRDTVYPARVNPLINTAQTGMAVWGARTLSPTSDAFIYINAVRLFQYVEKSIFNSTQSYVFESIGPNLYTAITSQMNSFLLGLFQQGYFAGASPQQAYSVLCDSTNNPPNVADAGQVICDVGIAPNRPGEFIRFRIAQKAIS